MKWGSRTVYTYLRHSRHEGEVHYRRCDGITKRGARCKFRANWYMREMWGHAHLDHYACKIHRGLGSWW